MEHRDDKQKNCFFTDLAAICAEPGALTSERRLGSWQTVSYETRPGKGVMLAARGTPGKDICSAAG